MKKPKYLFDEAGNAYKVQTKAEIKQDVQRITDQVFSMPIDWNKVNENEIMETAEEKA